MILWSALLKNETNFCWCGAEDGSLSQVQIHGGGKASAASMLAPAGQGGNAAVVDALQEAINRPNIDRQDKIRRGVSRGLRNISETP